MAESLTVEDSKLLIELCRAGKLYAVQEWISAGKSIRVAPGIKKTPLDVAIALGFHSLVELLAQAETGQEQKDKALADALDARRLDLMEVLVANGANVRSIPLADVFDSWQPRIIDFFLGPGVDVIIGAPFAQAFGQKCRKALRPFREYREAHPEFAEALQNQADRALRHFAYEADLKWVALMLWIGADPRSRGPTLDDNHEDDPECHVTAVEEACTKGSVEVLKKFKVDGARDDLSALLHHASLFSRIEMIRYLLQQGADPNDKTNGGSSALERCLERVSFGVSRSPSARGLISALEVWRTTECLRLLLSHGARWVPNDPRHLNTIRRGLYKYEPAVTRKLVKMLIQHKACSNETIQLLLNERLKEHLRAPSAGTRA
jgi:ankyrin repeat protein